MPHISINSILRQLLMALCFILPYCFLCSQKSISKSCRNWIIPTTMGRSGRVLIISFTLHIRRIFYTNFCFIPSVNYTIVAFSFFIIYDHCRHIYRLTAALLLTATSPSPKVSFLFVRTIHFKIFFFVFACRSPFVCLHCLILLF